MKLLSISLWVCVLTSFLSAQEVEPVTSIVGKVALPEEIDEGINVEGLNVNDGIITLSGKYNHPRMPYPDNWRELTPEQRQLWRNDFVNSDNYPAYQQKVEEARNSRFSTTAKIAKDGSFKFEGIKASWYELTVQIMPPNTDFYKTELARAYSLRQFFVKDMSQPRQLGRIVLKVKNVLLPGEMAPDFTVNKFDGTTFKLSDHRGKYVLFDFWATWCGPCIGEIPNLEAVYEEFSGERFKVIGLSVDDKISDAVAFLKKNPSHYIQGHVGEEEQYLPIQKAYGIGGIPSIWLIDPDGKIIARDLRGKGIRAAVEEALRK